MDEVIPLEHLIPIDHNLVRLIAAENAHIVDSDDESDFD